MESDFDFLVKEYERLHQLTLREIQSSEQRVNYFLTILTGTFAGLFVMLQKAPQANLDYSIFAAIVIDIFLLIFGLFSFLNRLLVVSLIGLILFQKGSLNTISVVGLLILFFALRLVFNQYNKFLRRHYELYSYL
jgi:hypothetical protein